MDHRPLAIIGFAESFSSPEVTWSLVDSGFRVWAFARRGSRAALRVSRYATVFEVTPPEQAAAAAIDELTSAIERLLETTASPKSGLLPLDDAALWICSQLKPHPKLAGVGPANPAFALNKDAQLSLARAAGFHVPDTLVLQSNRDLTPPPFGFPLILKPVKAISLADGRLSKGRFYICHSAADYESALEMIEPDETMMAQRYVSGVGEGLFGLATRERAQAWSSHRRIRMMNPSGSGASASMSVAAKPVDIAAGINLIKNSAWRGPFMIELLRDDSGKAWFMEFNGRVWGSTALARRCGLEYPAWAVLDAISEAPDLSGLSPSPLGVVCRHAGREIIHGLFVLRGPSSHARVKWPSRWRTLARLLRFSGSEHWYNWRRQDWRVFFRDLAVTVGEVVFKQRRSS